MSENIRLFNNWVNYKTNLQIAQVHGVGVTLSNIIKNMEKGIIVHSVIYNVQRKVLIIKRAKANDVLPGYWDIPGGTLEDGEDPVVGAIRETREETGLDISGLRLFFEHSTVDAVKGKQFVTLVFAAIYPGGEVTLDSEEHEEYAWIAPREIGKYKTVDYLEDALKAFTGSEDFLESDSVSQGAG